MKTKLLKDSLSLRNIITRKRTDLERQHLLRNPLVIEKKEGKFITINERRILSFASNDYLGINHKINAKKLSDSISKYGIGTASSRLIQGNTDKHVELETNFARFKSHRHCLLFNSAYSANIGIIQSLADSESAFLSDELNHASIIDGLRLAKSSGAKVVIYKHCDIEDLEIKLQSLNSEKKYIITETLFSIDGDIAPIKEIEDIADRFNAVRIYDETHATGLYGYKGAGLLEHFKVSNDNFIAVSNLSKGAGYIGGFVTSNADINSFLLSTSRPLIYTTSLPAFLCELGIQVIKNIKNSSDCRTKLFKNISLFIKTMDYKRKVGSPIISFLIGDNRKAILFQNHILGKGMYVPCLRPPTVPAGTARLRISLSALHSQEDIKDLCSLLRIEK